MKFEVESITPGTKTLSLGNFIFSTERASTVASFALGQILNDLPDDYYETFIENINKV